MHIIKITPTDSTKGNKREDCINKGIASNVSSNINSVTNSKQNSISVDGGYRTKTSSFFPRNLAFRKKKSFKEWVLDIWGKLNGK